MSANLLTHWTCITCRRNFLPGEIQYTCPACGGNLDARYDYDNIRPLMTPEALDGNPDTSLWRYASFYPNSLERSPLNLTVGMTPLTRTRRLGRALGLDRIWVKNDTLNPSGSFKDRASLMILAHCMENNISTVSGASTGNAGTSMACLAAAAGLEAVIFVPETAPHAKIVQLMVYGARLALVKGDYGQAFDMCEQLSRRRGWFNRNTGTNPYTREGKKTVSFEIWEQMGCQCPDAVVVTVGDGNIISGVYKGFFDLHQAGLIPRIPRIIGVQASGSAAIARAFHSGDPIRRIQANTIADSISAGSPSDGQAALEAVRASGGTFVTLEDNLILDAIPLLARTEGIFAEPSGAAGVEGVRHLVQSGELAPGDSVVVIATGNGLKDVAAAQKVTGLPRPVDPDQDPDAVFEEIFNQGPRGKSA